MNILYDHQIFFWQKYGGISRYFYEIITRMALKEECDVDLFQGIHVNEYGLEMYNDKCSHYFGYKRKIIPHTGRIFSKINKVLLNNFSKGKQYDIYHPTYYESFLLSNNYTTIVTVYDMIHELFKDEFLGDKTSLKKNKIISRADAIIAISESTKRDLINLLEINENKIKVIYLANSLSHKVTAEKIVNTPYILFVGNRNGYKNFQVLIKAFARCNLKKDIKIVCFGGSAFSKEEIEILDHLKMRECFYHYSGGDDLLANLYHHAELFVYPSKYEGFGIPPLEAMHYGAPVIAAKSSSIPEVVGNAGLYFDPSSEEELAENIKLLLYDKELKKKLMNLGFKQEQKFSWEKCADETMQCYQAIRER